jgi:hypothetical protein
LLFWAAIALKTGLSQVSPAVVTNYEFVEVVQTVTILI